MVVLHNDGYDICVLNVINVQNLLVAIAINYNGFIILSVSWVVVACFNKKKSPIDSSVTKVGHVYYIYIYLFILWLTLW